MTTLRKRRFRLADIVIEGDESGRADAAPVLFLHGGGQTRHSWSGAVAAVAARGFHAVSVDLRGHGESGWSPDGRYLLERYVDDIASVCAALRGPVTVVGASLGGLIGMGLAERAPEALAALVLVDIVPHVPEEGASHVRGFMASATDGFASIDEAAAAVASYLPHRERPRDTGGLRKNLRLRHGRYYWHWDPAMLDPAGMMDRREMAARFHAALASAGMPLMLVRGGLSRIVTREGATEFRGFVPRAEIVEVGEADHMVAGDSNGPFADAVIAFLERHRARISAVPKRDREGS